MIKYNYDSFTKEKKEKYFALRAKLGRKRSGVSRFRNEEERNYLILWNKARWDKLIKTGELEETGPRSWRINL